MPCSEPDFGVYVHWPFCKAKCPYCDFNSHVRREPVDAASFAVALASELQWFAAQCRGRRVTSVFFGGGTPSLMPPRAVAHVLDEIARLWPMAPDAEITLEANPTSIEAENFRGYRAAGVNRVSVGVQALVDADLRALGRQHTAAEALAAFRLAARIFPRVSFDMIYARPRQTPAEWRRELGRALAEQQGHMSLYQLTIEPGTAYFDLQAGGALTVPGEDDAKAFYDLTHEMTEMAGLLAYEVSNHAAPGHESRHNLLYWRYGEYAGVGPGAHSRIGPEARRRALLMEKHPERWRGKVLQMGNGVIEDEPVTPADQAAELLIMGLRLSEGVDVARYEALAGRSFDLNRIADLTALGLIRCEGPSLRATPAGRCVLNALVAELSF